MENENRGNGLIRGVCFLSVTGDYIERYGLQNAQETGKLD